MESNNNRLYILLNRRPQGIKIDFVIDISFMSI